MSASVASLRVEPGRTVLAPADGGAAEVVERQTGVRPFLKWTGGKQWLATVAPGLRLVPEDWQGRYYEPFLGGGSVFFSLGVDDALLSDANEELIEAYRGVKESPEDVIAALNGYPHDQSFFEAMRNRKPRTPHTKAARMIYLNKTAFNGMYRVNRRGQFNVPFGRYKNPMICPADRIRQASVALQNAQLVVGDFEDSLAEASAGALVYLDPPYITGHRNNGFLKYNAALFSWEDQQRLARLAVELADRGAVVMVSNSDHDEVTSLYSGFRKYAITRNTLIGGVGSERGPTREALLSSVPVCGVETRRV